jgi:transcriptional regulator with XRE-family HTH domain
LPTSNQASDGPDDYVILGRALRELRDGAALTQEQVAKKVGVGATYVSQVEHGHRGVRWHTLRKLLQALDADLRQLGDALDHQEQKDAE